MIDEPTDDQLLSYLIGDLDQVEKQKIDQWLQLNNENKESLKTLVFLKSEINNSPLIPRKKTMAERLPLYLLRASLLATAFIIGLATQAYWPLLAQSNNTHPLSPLSEPMSMESKNTGQFL